MTSKWSAISRRALSILAAGLMVLQVSGCARMRPSLISWGELPRPFGLDIGHMLFHRFPRSSGNRVMIHVGGEASFQAMLDIVASAQRSLYVEMFIFHNDESGQRLADAMIARARAGVKVMVQLDSLGLEVGRTDYRIIDRLKTGGVEVGIHNPMYWGQAGFDLTHRKIFVADGYHALTGGANVGDEFRYGYMDTMIEVWGQAAYQILAALEQTWGPLDPGLAPPRTPFGDEDVQVMMTKPGDHNGLEIRDAYMTAVRCARRSIDIAFPYFYDEGLVHSVHDALKRGVRVRVLLPDWQGGSILHALNQQSAKTLAEAGATISLYPNRFLHVKYMAVDGNWLSLGSANGDPRSLESNYELNLFFFRPQTVLLMTTMVYEPLWTASHKVTSPAAYEPAPLMGLLLPVIEPLRGWF